MCRFVAFLSHPVISIRARVDRGGKDLASGFRPARDVASLPLSLVEAVRLDRIPPRGLPILRRGFQSRLLASQRWPKPIRMPVRASARLTDPRYLVVGSGRGRHSENRMRPLGTFLAAERQGEGAWSNLLMFEATQPIRSTPMEVAQGPRCGHGPARPRTRLQGRVLRRALLFDSRPALWKLQAPR